MTGDDLPPVSPALRSALIDFLQEQARAAGQPRTRRRVAEVLDKHLPKGAIAPPAKVVQLRPARATDGPATVGRARQPLRAQVTEADWLALVRDLARTTGWRCYHTHNSRRSDAGFPDLVLVRPPELVVTELKAERGRVTPAQARWIAELQACGVEVHVWRPSDADVVVARLRRAS